MPVKAAAPGAEGRGSSFPYFEFLPKEGQACGVQIDMDPRMLSIRYPMELGLVGDAALTLWRGMMAGDGEGLTLREERREDISDEGGGAMRIATAKPVSPPASISTVTSVVLDHAKVPSASGASVGTE